MGALSELLPQDDLPLASEAARRKQHASRCNSTGMRSLLGSTRRSPCPRVGEPPMVTVKLTKPVPTSLTVLHATAAGWPARNRRGVSASRWPPVSGNGTGLTRCQSAPFNGRLRSAPLGGRARTSPQASPSMLRARSATHRLAPSSCHQPEEDGCPATVETSKEPKEPGFHLDLQRVSKDAEEMRKRQHSTRSRLDHYRKTKEEGLRHAASNESFAKEVSDVRSKVGCLMEDFMQDWFEAKQADEELEVLGEEIDALVETDVRMSSLLARMSAKLDYFEKTLGHCHKHL
eukprot:TRINITY_DN96998_c0_g1_i1.p1 TRINITY_DN96998_c0_g1~~TRINITY_DN96998_c0_g1_i1.p1  ORF type:complete len:289 (-),score=42.30 TRINITY_DN96998_c0_g1_i1:56-922(-)